MVDIRGRLRAGTRDWHDRAEAALDLPRRLRDRQSYAQLLADLHGFYAPQEAALRCFAAWPPALDLEQRCKASLIEADLRDLGYSADALTRLPNAPASPVPQSLPEALGTLYVLEGATLGGQVIRRTVEETFGPGTARATRHFSSYGPQVGPMWRAFLAELEHGISSPADLDQALRAAEGTFRRLCVWLGIAAHRRQPA